MSSTLSRLERLELIKARVKSDDETTIGGIARELGVSVRTLHRDIHILREQGVPIEADRGRGGGVRLHRSWGTGQVNLTFSESVGLLISLAVAEQMKSPLFLTDMTAIRHKIAGSFSSTMSRRLEELRMRILVGKPASSHMIATHQPPNPDVMAVLHEAFLLQTSTQIKYHSLNDVYTERTIQPHYLLLSTPIWYVLAWDELRNDVRTFRCDRIINIVILDTEFDVIPFERLSKSMEGLNAIEP